MTIKVGGYVPATHCVGMASPGARNLMAVVLARFPAMRNGGIYVCRTISGTSSLSQHATGRALDIMTGTGNPTRESKILAEQMRIFSAQLGVQGIIHNRRDWFSNGGLEWTPYNGTNPHYDHSHVELDDMADDSLTMDHARRCLVGPAPTGSIHGKRMLFANNSMKYADALYAQSRLNAHGFSLREDGYFGDNSSAALRVFQTVVGIVADGICGPITYGRLQ